VDVWLKTIYLSVIKEGNMHQRYQLYSFVVSSLLILLSIQPLFSRVTDLDGGTVLYKYEGKSLRDSKWGRIPVFQKALSESLEACGKVGIVVDGRFGRGTRTGIINLLSCSEFEELAVSSDHNLYGTVHSALWQRLLPDTLLPTVHERAFSLSLTHEGTDYDRVEWNYNTADDKSALTWGPFGATVGWGNEVRAILRRVDQKNSDLLKNTFVEEFTTVSRLMDEAPQKGYELLKAVYDDPNRRGDFKKKLQTLGTSADGRAAYDWYAFESDEWLKPNLRRLYSLIPNAKSKATEIDYAFFLDLGMHAGIGKKRINDSKNAIKTKEEELGRGLSPSERRRVISEVFVNAINQRWREDRIGRNVVFYIDGVKQENLTEIELNAWKNRTGRKASNYGLSDDRKYYPNIK
jgi:hypothetical protein